ncbi:MAG: DUF4124 domain-containing protein [Gammaproteobacteria bacterium]|nr:DUF4124 domain-containing protein [Gammaproteobacteria bacterium]
MKHLYLLLLLSGPAMAQVYKCESDGKTTYSQVPCAEDAQATDYSRENTASVDAAQVVPVANANAAAATIDRLGNAVKKRDLKAKIERLKRQIVQKTKERDAKMAYLRNTKRQAYNNLAGATWEESLSTEMDAVANQYATDIEATNKEIDRLIVEYEKL